MPISVVAGFIVGALFAAAVGASAATAGVVGVCAAAVAAIVAWRFLRGPGILGGEGATGAARNGPDNHPNDTIDDQGSPHG